jgi:predicted XRE-type DNA-binding protein
VDHALPELFKHNLILKDLPFNKGKPGILKSRNNPPANRIDKLDHLKIEYVEKIKEFKRRKNLNNHELISLTGINRVFLSRILNNKFEKISVEYLKEKADALQVLTT